MDPVAAPPELPYTVRADRAGAVRRARIGYPVIILCAVAGGAAIGVLPGTISSGPVWLGWLAVAVLLVAVVAVVVAFPHAKSPPQDDWLFRLEGDGLRFPPGARARRTMPGHPGLLLPWPLVTSLTPRRLNGQPTVVVGVRPEAEAILLAQGASAAQARVSTVRGFRLRLAHGALDPAACVRLLEATRAERMTPR